MIDRVRTLSHLLSLLVIATLVVTVISPEMISAPGGLTRLLDHELLLVAPTAITYLALKAHLRRDHSDSLWAAEVAAFAWALCSAQTVMLVRLNLAASATALLFAAHLMGLEAQRRRAPRFLVGAGLAGTLAGLALPEIALPLAVVTVHAIFGGARHLPGPRFEVISGRAMATIGGVALAVGGSLLLGMPASFLLRIASLPSPSGPDLTRLFDALFAGPGAKGLLLQTPWLLLAALGLGLWWRRGARRPLLWVTLSILLATILTPLLGLGAATLALLPALPFLAGPTARLLSSLRDRPGRKGPRSAGAALGLGVMAVLLQPALGVGGSWTETSPPLVAIGLPLGIALLLALLLPGRASRRGRLEALALALPLGLLGGALFFWMSLR